VVLCDVLLETAMNAFVSCAFNERCNYIVSRLFIAMGVLSMLNFGIALDGLIKAARKIGK
jgi:hypothetical protein